jgi:hypothetical protein
MHTEKHFYQQEWFKKKKRDWNMRKLKKGLGEEANVKVMKLLKQSSATVEKEH